VSSPAMAPKGPKVSPARTIVSLILLAVVGVVCLIEMRAGLGQYLSGKKTEAGTGKRRFRGDSENHEICRSKGSAEHGPHGGNGPRDPL